MGCVPQKMQLRGTWEFVGYKDERVQSIFEIDNTICFDGDGNGLYYPSGNPTLSNSFSYVISEDHKLVIIQNEQASVVDYSIDAKEKRLSLDGLEYRFVSSETEGNESEIEEVNADANDAITADDNNAITNDA